jgi:hypothetical protein
MTQHAFAGNPFMLMINPELILDAMEKSERLGQLNRHLCRPLDRQAGEPPALASSADCDPEGVDADDEAVPDGGAAAG